MPRGQTGCANCTPAHTGAAEPPMHNSRSSTAARTKQHEPHLLREHAVAPARLGAAPDRQPARRDLDYLRNRQTTSLASAPPPGAPVYGSARPSQPSSLQESSFSAKIEMLRQGCSTSRRRRARLAEAEGGRRRLGRRGEPGGRPPECGVPGRHGGPGALGGSAAARRISRISCCGESLVSTVPYLPDTGYSTDLGSPSSDRCNTSLSLTHPYVYCP